MHQKIMTGIFVTIIFVLFIVCSGCTSLQERTTVPTTQTPAATETHTVVVTPLTTPSNGSEVASVGTLPPRDDVSGRDGTSDHDVALDLLFVKSGEEISNKTGLVIQAMVPGTANGQLFYSASVLYLRAEDLGFTNEKYYDQLINMKADTPENEAKRIAYLQFLSPAMNAAYHLADAAEAESIGDYQEALDMAVVAKGDLAAIEINPDRPPIILYTTLDVFLDEYIGRMREKVIESKINERLSRDERSPRLP